MIAHADVEGLMTAEELERLDTPGKSTELVRGKLIVREPVNTYHGHVQSNLHVRVGLFVRERRLGAVFGQDTGFLIGRDPDTVRAPDLAFLKRELLTVIPERGFAPLTPSLVVEILSSGDRPGEVLAKIADWIRAGVEIAWVIDPHRRDAQIYRADGSISLVAPDGALDGEHLLTGFTCALADIFEQY